jgi:radical SAM protein with 4Fe4S-binding SPASM domain
MKGLPWAVSIEPTTNCNLRCPECPTGQRSLDRPGGNLNLALFSKIIEQMQSHVIYITLYFQGEPFLNNSFIEMVKVAKKNRLFVTTSTNGHFLDDAKAKLLVESGLDRLIISMDGTDQESYEKYRVGGNLATVKSGIVNVIQWKKRLKKKFPLVELQFLVLGTNQHQLDDIKKLAKELNVDTLTLKSAQLSNVENNPFLTTEPGLSRYSNNNFSIKSSLPNYCHRMWNSPVIPWNGIIIPCCFDKNADYSMGDLNKSSFKDVWNSEKYKSFRKEIFSNRHSIQMCCNCNEGLSKD